MTKKEEKLFERESFTFFKSWEVSICNLEDKDQLHLYRAIIRFSLFGEEPVLDSPLARMAWVLIKPIIVKARTNSANGMQAKGISKPSLIGKSNRTKNKSDIEAKCKPNKSDIEAKQKVDTITDTITDTNIVSGKGTMRAKAQFTPPTLQEVKDYCSLNGFALDCENFIDYYSSQNWKKANNQKVCDWKACVRSWVRAEKNKVANTKPTGYPIGMVYKEDKEDKEKERTLF